MTAVSRSVLQITTSHKGIFQLAYSLMILEYYLCENTLTSQLGFTAMRPDNIACQPSGVSKFSSGVVAIKHVSDMPYTFYNSKIYNDAEAVIEKLQYM